MIKIIKGNLFNSQCDIITNAVNCVGIMGAGIAKAFADKYPKMYDEYKEFCKNKKYKLGMPVIHCTDNRLICNFPTMFYPGSLANREAIQNGLFYLKGLLDGLNQKDNSKYISIAFCALGCGIGRFSFEDLKNMIENIFQDYEGLIEVYEPIR